MRCLGERDRGEDGDGRVERQNAVRVGLGVVEV